jgi:3-oxoacyl-[acyl-carrier-protein] synthase III
MNLQFRGNISAASAIVALDDAYREGLIKKGNLIAFVAFGGGLTWGASLVRW